MVISEMKNAGRNCAGIERKNSQKMVPRRTLHYLRTDITRPDPICFPTISGSNTTLDGPDAIAVDSSWIYVANLDGNSILVFPLGASDNTAPARTISGSNTALDGPGGIALDPSTPSRVSSVPAMSEWSMIIFIVFAGAGSAYYLKKGKTRQM